MNVYLAGTAVTVQATFETNASVAIDPTTLTFEFGSAGGTLTTYTYGVGTQVVRLSTGVYQATIDTTLLSGLVNYLFVATGSITAITQGQFSVQTPILTI